jgi:exodeoxyribonuclease-3
VGWRIDYQAASSTRRLHPVSASIAADVRFSDHAPLVIDYSGQ